MATLPNFDLSTTETVATWDVGVNITADERDAMLAKLASFTSYDNGFDGTMWVDVTGALGTATDPDSVKVQVRMRSDGLLYAWHLRADEPTPTDWDAGNTVWDDNGLQQGEGHPMVRAAYPVHDGSWLAVTVASRLSMALLRLEEEVTDAGKTAFAHSGVSYHDPVNSTATHVYIGWEKLTDMTQSSLSHSASVSADAGNVVHALGAAWYWNSVNDFSAKLNEASFPDSLFQQDGAGGGPSQQRQTISLNVTNLPSSSDTWDFTYNGTSSTRHNTFFAVVLFVEE